MHELRPAREQVQRHLAPLAAHEVTFPPQHCERPIYVPETLQITICWVTEPWGFFQTQKSKGSTQFEPYTSQTVHSFSGF